MKVLIDTNVLISAILKDKEPEKAVLFVASHTDMEWIVSPQIMAEYKDVLCREKFALPEDIRFGWFEMLDALTTVVESEVTIQFPRDQKDAKFLECALASNAHYFISGDRDFNQAQKMLNTTILSVSQFIKLVCDAVS